MLTLRPSAERGSAEHGWLHAKHTFSFSDYYDPKHMGYRTLRVINEDKIEPKAGFPTHGHKDMEIITYIISGALEHKDSMGNGSVIRHGEMQYMSAGKGVRHSEFNHEQDQLTHLLQIWIVPDKANYEPAYDQIKLSIDQKKNQLHLVVSPVKAPEVIHVRQDVKVYACALEAGKTIERGLDNGRGLWLQLIRGEITVNGVNMKDGDGLVVENEPAINLSCQREAEFLLFDLK